MDIIEEIRIQQARAHLPLDYIPPKHQPEMLYIGCIDARLDPVKDIGIKQGKALIFRNIGAMVTRCSNGGKPDPDTIEASGEVAHHVSIGAALEFFLNHLPAEEGKIKHIVISGHTDCGGLKACQHGLGGHHDHYLSLYLNNLSEVRAKVMERAKAHGWDDAQILSALEKESVRKSMKNLLTYDAVQKAIKANRLQVHGWVINTATKRISEMHPDTQEFEPMTAGPR